jgi:hypothetical protein
MAKWGESVERTLSQVSITIPGGENKTALTRRAVIRGVGLILPRPLFRQLIQQLLMDAAKTAVAHHQNMVARVGGFHHHIRQRIDIGAPVRRLDAGFRHFRHLPRNMLRLQQEHFIGAA